MIETVLACRDKAFEELVEAKRKGLGKDEVEELVRKFRASSERLEELLVRVETGSEGISLSKEEKDLADKLKAKIEVIDKARGFIGSWDNKLEALIAEKEEVLHKVSALVQWGWVYSESESSMAI